MTKMCARCGQHPATVTVANSVLDYVHGHYEEMCECCNTWTSLIQAREAAARIPDLEKQLAASCVGTTGEPPPEIPWGWEGWQDGMRAAFWHEDLKAVTTWAGQENGRAIAGMRRRPAWVASDSQGGEAPPSNKGDGKETP